jgi:hypothetical protein
MEIQTAKVSYIDFGQVVINEGWGLSEKGAVAIADCGGSVYSKIEAEDDLTFLAVMIGVGFTF